MKYDVIIGIDPDTIKSGVAVLVPSTRNIQVYSLTFPELLDFLLAFSKKYDCVKNIVVIEAGWMHEKSDFRDTKGKAATRIAKNVGANHETGKKLIEMCKHYGLDVLPHIPLKKGWKGKDGKITQVEIEQFIALPDRTNQEERDAALLAWCFANLPIRIKT